MVRVTLNNGHYVDCTEYHGFVLENGNVVEARNLSAGDKLERLTSDAVNGDYANAKPFTPAYLAGFYSGDGWVRSETGSPYITFYGEEKLRIGEELGKAGLVKLQDYNEIADRRVSRVLVEVKKDYVPVQAEAKDQLEWLAGLLDSDGNVTMSGAGNGNYGYQICSIDKEFLRKTALVARALGATGHIGLMKKGEQKEMPGGIYQTQDCYRLTIASFSVAKLLDIGLPVQRLYSGPNNPQRDASRYPLVESVESIGVEDEVYCFNEPLRHRGVFNGILTSQCGEVPLLNNEPCNLGSINLGRFVKSGSVDYNTLGPVVRLATRYLDDVVTLNTFPQREILEANLQTRKLGLGVCGWADMLALLGVDYDSDDAVHLASEVMEFINAEATEATHQLGAERGCAPAYNAVSGVDRRNATVTCIAPTGSIAILMDASSGIEPYFAEEWKRTLGNGEVLNEGTRLAALGHKPHVSHDIAPVWHIRTQAAFQSHTDLAVSKTINLPHSASISDVYEAYRMMWETGCKGGTIYRDGSRDEQVLEVVQLPLIESCEACGAGVLHMEGCIECADRCGWSACAT
jgi:ribonucleoside-diphosphate reductase alpha chain